MLRRDLRTIQRGLVVLVLGLAFGNSTPDIAYAQERPNEIVLGIDLLEVRPPFVSPTLPVCVTDAEKDRLNQLLNALKRATETVSEAEGKRADAAQLSRRAYDELTQVVNKPSGVRPNAADYPEYAAALDRLRAAEDLGSIARQALKLAYEANETARMLYAGALFVLKGKQCPPPQTSVQLISVQPHMGNNPFDPTNPLGGGQVKGRICITPHPSDEPEALPCPSGQTGSIIRTRSYSCVNGSWAPGDWTTTSSTCTATPPPGCTTPQPVVETQPQSCPTGQVGAITQTRSYICLSGTWTPSAWLTVSNSCTCNPAVQPQPDSQNLSCPAGQTGSITQQRAYVCSNGSWVSGTNWSTVNNTCTTAQTGCATSFGSGNYVCSGSCSIGLAGLTVTPGSSSMTASTFGSNSNVGFNCSGPSASSQSTNLIILGAPGHRCTLNGMSSSSLSVLCQNNGGGSCNSSCSR